MSHVRWVDLGKVWVMSWGLGKAPLTWSRDRSKTLSYWLKRWYHFSWINSNILGQIVSHVICTCTTITCINDQEDNDRGRTIQIPGNGFKNPKISMFIPNQRETKSAGDSNRTLIWFKTTHLSHSFKNTKYVPESVLKIVHTRAKLIKLGLMVKWSWAKIRFQNQNGSQRPTHQVVQVGPRFSGLYQF